MHYKARKRVKRQKVMSQRHVLLGVVRETAALRGAWGFIALNVMVNVNHCRTSVLPTCHSCFEGDTETDAWVVGKFCINGIKRFYDALNDACMVWVSKTVCLLVFEWWKKYVYWSFLCFSGNMWLFRVRGQLCSQPCFSCTLVPITLQSLFCFFRLNWIIRDI